MKRSQKKFNWVGLIGNLMMLSALSFLVLIYGPIGWMFLFPKQITPVYQLKGFAITIPEIDAQATIIPQVDPWNEQIYDAALQKGVAQAKNSSYPGQKGTLYLFAHSSTWAWNLTSTNTPFLRLGELQPEDEIYITWNGKVYIYKVTQKKEIWPNETGYLQNLAPTQLILQTCTPIGTSLQRLLVFAEPEKEIEISDR